jgi:transcriptional regulator with XRE-family HTH domain
MGLLGTPNVRCGKQTAVSTEQHETLSDFVRRVANEKGLAYREVARRSGLSSPSISDIVSGKTRNIKSSTIPALAKGLGVTDEEILAVIGGKPLDYKDPLDLRVLFDGWEEATDEERAATLDDVRMIAERFQRRRQRKPPDKQKGKK